MRLSLLSWFHTLYHDFTSDDLLCICCNSWPAFCCFSRNWAFDVRSLDVTLFVRDHASVVFELDPCSIDTAEWSALSDDNSVKHLASGFWSSLLDGDFCKVTNAISWVTSNGVSEFENVDDLNNLCAGVVRTCNRAAVGKPRVWRPAIPRIRPHLRWFR